MLGRDLEGRPGETMSPWDGAWLSRQTMQAGGLLTDKPYREAAFQGMEATAQRPGL